LGTYKTPSIDNIHVANVAKRRRPTKRRDRPESKIGNPKHVPFIELNEVTWDDLETWYIHSMPREKVRIPKCARYASKAKPLGFMETARHRTTAARGKDGRFIDTYWFVPVADRTQYIELAQSDAIPKRKTIIPPPFLPRLKRLNGQKRTRRCRHCNEVFTCKRIDAEYCPNEKCRKAAARARKRK
jgi:hypothetical protein